MWNTHYSNRRCNEIEKVKEHKLHLERLVTVKTMLDINEPVKPSFLINKAKKKAMEEEKQSKIFYENNVLVKKIIDITAKPSPYNAVSLQVKRCPAYDKTYFQVRKKKYDLEKENLKLYKRLVSAKPYYKTEDVVKDYMHSRYLENMISQTKNRSNPSLHFESPNNFRRRLQEYLSSVGVQNANQDQGDIGGEDDNLNTEYINQMRQRPHSAHRIPSGKTYSKKPHSGMTKASASTNYTHLNNY